MQIPYSLLPDDALQRLQLLQANFDNWSQVMLGYPAAVDFDYQELLPFFGYMLNNVGDPQTPSLYHLDTRAMEREVIDFFTSLFRAQADSCGGYVTNGGTESNLHALHVARELYPDAITYYSNASHYSIKKNLHLLRMDSQEVGTQPHGEIDYDDLRSQLNRHAGKPAIIVANIGTTMTEARDDVAVIRAAAQSAGCRQVFIHSDGALGGIPSAFLPTHRPFDFADGADSISISGHKFIGAPFPCGLVLVKRQHQQDHGEVIAYTNALDSTISGSRSGHAPLLLWYAIQRFGIAGFRKRTEESLDTAAYAHRSFEALGWECWRNPDALTIVLRTPPPDIARKWQLATADGWSHVLCMPGVQRQTIDAFAADLQASLKNA